jgi:hypothetical protein
MKRRRLIITFAVFCLVAMVVWWLWPAPGITRSNCDRIKQGMSEPEVDVLFGCPAGDYCTPGSPIFHYVGSVPVLDMPRWREATKVKIWYVDSGETRVLFDRSGQVVGKAWIANPGFVDKPTWFTRIWNRVLEWWSPSKSPTTMPASSVLPIPPPPTPTSPSSP